MGSTQVSLVIMTLGWIQHVYLNRSQPMEEKVMLGDKARDKLNGFEGRVTARTEYVTGCVYILLENIDADGNPVEHWVDEKRVEVLEVPRAVPKAV
jgi:hypothetical protein